MESTALVSVEHEAIVWSPSKGRTDCIKSHIEMRICLVLAHLVLTLILTFKLLCFHLNYFLSGILTAILTISVI